MKKNKCDKINNLNFVEDPVGYKIELIERDL